MKQVKAFIQPFMVAAVEERLKSFEGLPGLAITTVHGFGRGASGVRNTVEKSEMQVVVPDALVEQIVAAIQEAAHTGNLGDGKIFISPVEDVIRIRTNERGEDAL